MAEQRAGERRDKRHEPLGSICFIDPDQAVGPVGSGFTAYSHLRAKANLILRKTFGLAAFFHEHGLRDAPLELRQAGRAYGKGGRICASRISLRPLQMFRLALPELGPQKR